MNDSPAHVVVIGGGMVSRRYLDALRERDTAGAFAVTLLCEEHRVPYDRVALTSYFTGSDPEDLALGDPRLWHNPLVTIRRGVAATGINREARTVTCSDGRTLEYDHLVLAAGSYAAVPPLPGRDLNGVFVYRTIDDVAALRAYVEQLRERDEVARSEVVGAVIGGGLLGLEAVGAFQALGVSSHVIEFADRLMPLQVDAAGGHALRRLIGQRGVQVRTAIATSKLTGRRGRVARIHSTASAPLDVDVVVIATGVRSRDELARAAGLPLGEHGGVIVGDGCTTIDPAVSAIGEVACIDGAVWASWPPAVRWLRWPLIGCSAAKPPSRVPILPPN